MNKTEVFAVGGSSLSVVTQFILSFIASILATSDSQKNSHNSSLNCLLQAMYLQILLIIHTYNYYADWKISTLCGSSKRQNKDGGSATAFKSQPKLFNSKDNIMYQSVKTVCCCCQLLCPGWRYTTCYCSQVWEHWDGWVHVKCRGWPKHCWGNTEFNWAYITISLFSCSLLISYHSTMQDV